MIEAIFAGWVAGYVVSIVFTVAGTWLFVDVTRASQTQNPSPVGTKTRVATLAVVFSTGGFLVWTLAGLLIGAAYGKTREEAGDSALTFMAFVGVFSLVVAAGVSMLLRRVTWQVVLVAVASVVCFGLLLPALAER